MLSFQAEKSGNHPLSRRQASFCPQHTLRDRHARAEGKLSSIGIVGRILRIFLQETFFVFSILKKWFAIPNDYTERPCHKIGRDRYRKALSVLFFGVFDEID